MGRGCCRYCDFDTLDRSKAQGKVVLCIGNNTVISRSSMKTVVQQAGGIGMIIVDDSQTSVATSYGTFPATTVSKTSATEIFSYIKMARCVRHILAYTFYIT